MTVPVTDLATRILTGTTLADKLAWEPVSWEHRPAPARVDQPGRAPALRFAPRGVNAPLPRRSHLDRPKARATLLHSFANHELLALELMAHALLAFPDAPVSFRKGLLTVLHDEQIHLQLYLDRVEELGMTFGEQPLSSYFWDVVSDAPTPLDFLARISLCFEQANLDFARAFGGWFRQAGDTASASILDQVYRDEIRHVRHGLYWFRKWKDPALSDWDAWVRRLQLPLSPSRARGTHFDRQVRREIGFDAETIGKLERWRRSRSRPPTLWWCNPLAESELAGPIPARIQSLARDLQLVPAALAAPEDTVVVRSLPSEAWMDRWTAAGLPLPELLAVPQGDLLASAIPHVDLSAVELWGSTPAARGFAAAAIARSKRPVPAPDVRVFRKDWSLPHRRVAASALQGEFGDLIVPQGVLGQVAETAAQADAAIAAALEHTGEVILKAPLGTAGRGAVRVSTQPTPPQTQRWIARTLRAQGAVVVEPWLRRVADLSLHFDLTPSGAAFVGWNRFWTDPHGRFVAASADGPLVDLPTAARRLLTADGRDRKRLARVGQRVAEALTPPLRALGHAGPVGVDAMLVELGGALRLHPALEVNPRWSFGRVGLRLGKRLAAPGVLALVRPADLGGPLGETWAAWERDHPVVLHGDGRLRGGVVAIGDPEQAGARLPVLGVGDSATALRQAVVANRAARSPVGGSLRSTGPISAPHIHHSLM